MTGDAGPPPTTSGIPDPPCPIPQGAAGFFIPEELCLVCGPRCYTVELPSALVLLNANDRPHWTRHRAITNALRVASAALARSQRIPPLQQAWITVVLHPHNRRRLDPHNWGPSAKAAIDGLIDAHVLPDDDYTHLVAVTFLLGQLRPARQLALHITPTAARAAESTNRKEPPCPA